VITSREHQGRVSELMSSVACEILRRGRSHDASKLVNPEKEAFESGADLTKLVYGTPEYWQSRDSLGEALKHHYSFNDHHPEHFEKGVEAMDLVQLVEMICDWVAAVERMKDGDISKSLEVNKERFGISDQLNQVFINTVSNIYVRENDYRAKEGMLKKSELSK